MWNTEKEGQVSRHNVLGMNSCNDLFPSNYPSLIALFLLFLAAHLHLQQAYFVLCFGIFIGYCGVHVCVQFLHGVWMLLYVNVHVYFYVVTRIEREILEERRIYFYLCQTSYQLY